MDAIIKRLDKTFTKDDRGILVTKEHEDFGFLSDDGVNWAEIEDDSFWYGHRNNVFAILANRFLKKRAIVEVGAGNGFVAKRLQDEGVKVIAVEPTYNWAVNARERGVETVVCSYLEDAGFPEQSLPNVGIFDVLEHVEDDFSFIKTIHGFLEKGGLVFCSVPAHMILWSNEDKDAAHFRRYSLSGLSQLFEKSGFEVIYSTYFFAVLLIPIFLLRALPAFLGIRRRRDPDRTEREHNTDSLVGRMLGRWLVREEKQLLAERKLRYGASCLLVARRS